MFNPGERVLSTTAPGYALALAGLARLGVDPVAGGRWLSAGALLAAAFLLLDIFRREGSPQTGFAAGLVLCFFPDLTADWGNECALLLGLFVAAGWLFQRHRPAACRSEEH
ncbi:MAG: hypothetical protein M1457_01215, partial [bacterium]|nr:hypothetical protein [bacterium]